MKKTITLEVETAGKNLDQASEQAILDAVSKAVESTQFTVTVKVQSPVPAVAAPAPAPPKA